MAQDSVSGGLQAPAETNQSEGRGAALAWSHGMRPDNVGYLLFDLQSGERLEEMNAEQPFMPASVVKVPTAVAALNILRPNFHFKTGVYGTGPVEDGILQGDLILRGGGDPFLATEHLNALASALAGQGIEGITGRFLYDETLFNARTEINALQPIDASYNPGLSALALNFNVVHLYWRRASPLTYSALSKSEAMSVEADTLRLRPTEESVPAGAALLYDGIAAGESWLLPASFPKEGSKRVPLKEPGPATAAAFRRLAAARGVSLPEAFPGAAPLSASLLAEHESPALYDIVELVLKWSNNQSAELIGLSAAQQINPRVRELERSAEVLAGWMRSRLPGVDWAGYELENNSGLSSASRATASQIAAILRFSESQRITGLSVLPLMKPLGIEGELSKQYGGSIRVRVKTGTINYGRALAGYLQSVRGRRLGFVTWAKDEEARALYDRNLQLGVQDSGKARFWLRRARAIENALIAEWVARY